MSYVNADTISGHPLSGSGKLVPAVKSTTQFPYAETPAPVVSQSFYLQGRRPKSVMVVNNRADDILFAFKKDAVAADWINFSSASEGSVIEISPVAWKGGATATEQAGDVIFIYKGEF